MNEHSNWDPWHQDSYKNGSTKPPKNRSGVLVILLVAVIFLGGIASVLGIMNVKLFQQLSQNDTDSKTPFFAASGTEETQSTQQSSNDFVPKDDDVTVELNKSPESVENIPQDGGLSYQQIYDKAIDSVVSIRCNTGTGTGVVLSKNGYLVTNCHVIDGAERIEAIFTDGRILTACVVGADTVSDLAVLYVQAEDLIPAEFGDSASLRVGDAVAAIGDPLGLDFRGTMTDGIVSAINRDVTVNGRTMTLIQTNAALNSGNSGGPLLNCYGQVVGINTMKIGTFTDDAGVEGLGFAIPSVTVKDVVDQLIDKGYVAGRPALGFTGQTVSQLDQRWYLLPAGVMVSAVTPDSNADKIGLSVGDIVLSIDNSRISSVEELENLLYSHRVGDSLNIVIYRSGKQYSATLTLGEAVQ